MASLSPRRTAVGHTLTRAASVTLPMTCAARWTKAVGWIVGEVIVRAGSYRNVFHAEARRALQRRGGPRRIRRHDRLDADPKVPAVEIRGCREMLHRCTHRDRWSNSPRLRGPRRQWAPWRPAPRLRVNHVARPTIRTRTRTPDTA